MKYIKCPHCSKIFNYKDNHLDNCTPNYVNDTLLCCFSCGEKNNNYSSSQLKKEDKARCMVCVSNNRIQKFEPYDYLHRSVRGKINLESINKKLIHAISTNDLEKVLELLSLNANPNYVIQDTFCYSNYRECFIYNADGSEKPMPDEFQPTTPLKMCVFSFSDLLIDCSLTEYYKLIKIKIAESLIKYGASTIGAREFYLHRYGTSPPKKPLWCEFYKVLFNE